MLPPIYYESCTDAVLAAYAHLEDAILSAMVKRILRMGFVSEATKHQAEMLQEAGLLYEDILQLIAQRTDACTAQVRALFEDAGVAAVEIDNQAYKKIGIATVDIRQSDSLRQVLEAGFKKTMGVMDNLTKTTALTTQRAFYQACNDAYMQITSGAFSYQEAIRNTLKQAARGGLSVTYPSGHIDKLDVAIRRAALTGVGQTAAEVSKTNAEENGCYLMEITAHSGARPEHAKWQGQLVSLTGKDVGKIIDGLKVWSLRDIGYGSGEGFRGWNCRHDWYPYFPGLSTPNYTKKELEQLDEKRIEWNGKQYTEYEISQMQRARERNVRELKRQTLKMQKAAELTDKPELKEAATADYQATAAKLKAEEEILKMFCDRTGQDRDRFREQVLGFSRSESQKAIHARKIGDLNFKNEMQQKGFKNPPESIAEFKKMMYNKPDEYKLMQTYSKSVDSGMMSPLVGYEKYKEYHKRVEKELVGLTTSNGIEIKSQSNHFLERVFGTISDPTHEGAKRSGVELEDIKEALLYGKVEKVKIKKKSNGELGKSQRFCTDKCFVSVNPDECILIQANPRSPRK